MKKVILLTSLLFFELVSNAYERIPADDKRIVIEGAKEVLCSDGKVILNRHSDAMWSYPDINNISSAKARTQSGIQITFRSDSPEVKPVFSLREGSLARKVNDYYGVYLNGEFVKDFPGDSLVLSGPSGVNEWRIVLPAMYGVDFYGLTLCDGCRLYDVQKKNKPVYIAFGDSITHGAGLKGCSSVASYPFTLAQRNGYLLYNAAVGGSQISAGVAEEYSTIKADVITVLWGYNDWNATKGDLNMIADRYEKFLRRLLLSQESAEIYVILPTTAADESGKTGYSANLNDVRDAERKVAASLGDERIVIIDGSKLTSKEGLNGQVHFNNDGSVRFGLALAELVSGQERD